MNRNLFFSVLIIIVVVFLAGVYFYFKKTPDVVNRKPEVTVTAMQLLQAFEQDTAAASQEYINKIVQVTGVVKRIDTAGAVVLGIAGSLSEVVMGLDRRHIKDYTFLQEGQTAVLQGICSGYSKSGSNDPTDMLAALGTTVHFRSAGVKQKKP